MSKKRNRSRDPRREQQAAVEVNDSEAAPDESRIAVSMVTPAAKKPSGFANLLLHLHPRMIPEEALKFERTFGLGGMALLLFLVLIVTGALLLFVYEPSTDRAYASVVAIRDEVPFGSFVRAIHHWAGNGLLIVSFLHLLRVFYTGAFLLPRRFNWILGLVLLAIIMAGNFTGYLLPWDQLSFWAVTIGTGMIQYVPLVGDSLMQIARGGADIGPKTLSLFFVAHIALLPILLFLLTSFHFWKIRKAGGVMLPRPEAASRPVLVPVRPNLTLREGVAAVVLLAVLLWVSAIFQAPLAEQANPGLSPNPAKAPWYFMGVQELLIHLHPAFAVLVVPFLGFAFVAGLSFLRYQEPHSGYWFHTKNGRRIVIRSTVAGLILASLAVVLNEYILHWSRILPNLPPVVSTGVIPMAMWAVAFAAIMIFLVRPASITRIETAQGVFTFLVAGFIALTLIGVFFRGQSMRLTWPW